MDDRNICDTNNGSNDAINDTLNVTIDSDNIARDNNDITMDIYGTNDATNHSNNGSIDAANDTFDDSIDAAIFITSLDNIAHRNKLLTVDNVAAYKKYVGSLMVTLDVIVAVGTIADASFRVRIGVGVD